MGTSDKKIVTWDTRSNEIVQEYDRHMGKFCNFILSGASGGFQTLGKIIRNSVTLIWLWISGAVNTITFCDENRRFVSTSDDKSLRVWEWDIPVDMKYIGKCFNILLSYYGHILSINH